MGFRGFLPAPAGYSCGRRVSGEGGVSCDELVMCPGGLQVCRGKWAGGGSAGKGGDKEGAFRV